MSESVHPPVDAASPHEAALGWFVRRRDAGWQPADEPAFQAWLEADARHAGAYRDCVEQWAELDAMPADLTARLRRQLADDRAVAVAAAVDHPADPLNPLNPLNPAGAAPGGPDRRRRHFLAWPARPALMAASLAAVGGLGLFGWRQLIRPAPWASAFESARGEQRDLVLPDGSRLRLDTATRLEVAFNARRREARLVDGQAVFEVAADADRPFEVRVGGVVVTVVGTRFSVRHTPDIGGLDGIEIAVDEGRVRVSHDDREIVLAPGQRFVSDRDGGNEALTPLAADGFAGWQRQRISFVDVPLGQALAELERYRPTGLFVSDPAVAALRLSGTFDPRSASALRTALPRVLPVRLREGAAGTEILARR